MIFLLISFIYHFFLSFWQIFTSRQTHDFSAHFLCILWISNLYFGSTTWFFFLDFKSLLCVKPIIFLPISFVYHSFQIFTSAQPHHFSSFSYMIWYKFKPLLRHKPMIFLLISFIYIMNYKYLLWLDPRIFLLFPI